MEINLTNPQTIRSLFFIIPVILLIHELEEWNIYDFHKNSYSSGVNEESKLGGRLWLIFLSLFGFCWTLICYFIPNIVIGTILMMLLVDFTLLNSIQHIGLSIKTKKYNPGLLFGGLFALLAVIFIVWIIVLNNILPVWLLVIILSLVIPGVIESAISSKNNKLPKMVEWILRFSHKLDKLFSD
ncbi:MAG: hypothetical protein C0410_03775 [Anaerolinea sp.]|nr:hypothetical protein [Anaerolinea sp.]